MHAKVNKGEGSRCGSVRVGVMALAVLAGASLAAVIAAAGPGSVTLKVTPDSGKATPSVQQAIASLERAVEHLKAREPEAAKDEIDRAEEALDQARQVLEPEAGSAPRWPQGLTGRPPFPSFWDDPFAQGGEDDSGWNPFAEIQRMQERMQRMFDDSLWGIQMRPGFTNSLDAMHFAPAANMTDDGDHYTVRFDLPGADKNQINVRLEDRTLTVSGQSESSSEPSGQGNNRRLMRSTSQFERSVVLPGPVNGDKLEAHYENGVLQVTVPKADRERKSHSITVT